MVSVVDLVQVCQVVCSEVDKEAVVEEEENLVVYMVEEVIEAEDPVDWEEEEKSCRSLHIDMFEGL